MKISRKELNKLIENYLNEDDTGDLKGGSSSNMYNNDPDIDDFELTDDMLDSDQSAHEEYVSAVDAYRNPSKPIGNMPNFAFGDQKGVSSRTQGTHIPSATELDHVRRYQSQEIGGSMPSVSNTEMTVPRMLDDDFDEDTEESPFGTQYSLDDTDEILDLSDEDSDFDFDRDESQDVITYEDEDGNERTFLGGKEITPGSYDEDEGMIAKIRKFLKF
jgi:hypothetical protein